MRIRLLKVHFTLYIKRRLRWKSTFYAICHNLIANVFIPTISFRCYHLRSIYFNQSVNESETLKSEMRAYVLFLWFCCCRLSLSPNLCFCFAVIFVSVTTWRSTLISKTVHSDWMFYTNSNFQCLNEAKMNSISVLNLNCKEFRATNIYYCSIMFTNI